MKTNWLFFVKNGSRLHSASELESQKKSIHLTVSVQHLAADDTFVYVCVCAYKSERVFIIWVTLTG